MENSQVKQSGKSYLTETDLFKICIIHPKYTSSILGKQDIKDNPYQSVQNPENSKNGLPQLTKEDKKERMKLYYKVWSGLTKLIRSQCTKGRCIDFPLVGKFMKRINLEDKFFFVPHIDFIESGKFQFPENDFNISPFSQLLMGITSTVAVSASSIGQVCQLERDAVMAILKEIFVKFIEQSRKGKEIKIDLKIGYLHSYPNSDLQFENLDYTGGNQNDRFNQKVRDKNALEASFDQQSTVYSYGGLTNGSCYMSVRTPATIGRKSQYSVSLSKTVNNWKTQRPKENNNSEIYSQFSKRKLNSSDYDMQYLKDKMKQNEYLNNETFDTFVLKKLNLRPGKRMIFPVNQPHQDKNDLLDNYLTNIRDKEKEKLEYKRKKIEEERLQLAENTKKIVKEKEDIKKISDQKKSKFKEGIDQVKQERDIQKLIEKQQSYEDPNSGFFPFTHGDHIERQREFMRAELKQDLQTKFLTTNYRNSSTGGNSRVVLQKPPQNNEYLMDTKSNRGNTPILIKYQDGIAAQENTKQEKLRQKFIQEYPTFMKPHQTVIARKPNEYFVQDAMVKARQRFEQSLMNTEKQHKMQQDEEAQQNQENNQYYQEMESLKKKQKLEVKIILEKQIEEERQKKQNDKNEFKVQYNTNYGPQETEEITQLLKDKKIVEQDYMKKILKDQISSQRKLKERQDL